MIDEVFWHLCSKITAEGWVDLDELSDFLMKHGLSQKEVEELMGFLEKYFLEVDVRARRVKFTPWAFELFKFSAS
jgi:hypothetical protein